MNDTTRIKEIAHALSEEHAEMTRLAGEFAAHLAAMTALLQHGAEVLARME